MKRVTPKKHLGQHFLTDENIAVRIADAVEKTSTCVLEIGPGTGILTRALIEREFEEFKLVEIDRESVKYLQERHPELQNQIIEGDFLKMDLKEVFDGKPFTVVGNFPYNISSQILFRVFENRELVPQTVGMFQREVAVRIASEPGNRDYGILSVLLQIYYDIEYLFTVSEHVFNPPPKVKSGVIKLVRNDRTQLPFSDEFMKKVVKTAFNQRRKTLRNSLKSLLTPQVVIPEDILKQRPEQLSAEEFIALAEAIYQSQP